MDVSSAKNRFVQSLWELLREKPIKQITVSELTKKAGLSRQTFYQSFTDKYELISYAWALEVNKIKDQSEINEPLIKVWTRRLKVIKEDQIIYKRLLEYMDDQNAFFYSWVDISVTTPSVMSNLMRGSPDMVFATKTYAFGTGMCVRDWIMGGCKKPPEEIARQMILSMPAILMPYILLDAKE